MQKHPEMTRKEIKEAFFREVLYSSSTSTKNKPFASDFKAMFPNVYELIGKWKKPSENAAMSDYVATHKIAKGEKEYAALSNVMQSLEACIMTDILKRLYAKRWDAVHIHDCIIVPAQKTKHHPSEDDVIRIMREVYAEYGLCPTFD